MSCRKSAPSKAKLEVFVKSSRDGFAICHARFEEHIQHIMPLANQYAFGSSNHFDTKEVMKVSQILHLKCVEDVRYNMQKNVY